MEEKFLIKNTLWTVCSVNLKQTADLKNTLYCCNVFTYGYQITLNKQSKTATFSTKKNTFLCLHLRPLRHTNKYILSGMFLPKATKTEIGRIYLENIFSVVYVYKLSSIILTYPLYN